MARIAIIGGGNMGEALLAGLLRAGRQVKDLVLAEKSPERAQYLANTYSVQVTSLANAVANAAFAILAVKPADIESVITEIANAAGKAESDAVELVLVSVIAGVTTGFYESHLPAGSPVIRVMPNAPALVGAGVTALAKGRFATPAQLSEAAALFECVGAVLTVPEAQLDAVTAVSGSGPAYFCLFVEALVDAGVQGLVVATTGNGTVHQDLEAALVLAIRQGVRVLRATRCTEGRLLPGADQRLPSAAGLNPVKARIALMLALMRSNQDSSRSIAAGV